MEEVRKVTNTDQQTVAADGTVINESAQSVKTDVGAKHTAINAVWYIFGCIAIILALRFILKLTGANPANGFVELVYAISGIFSVPFDTMFGVAKAEAGAIVSVFEPSILVAIAVYALLAWGVARLLAINEPHKAV